VLELAIMPFVLLLRLVGAARWPVEIARHGKHFATKYAPDLAEAATLQTSWSRSSKAERRSTTPSRSRDSKPESMGRLED
jgi:hypothetical protein